MTYQMRHPPSQAAPQLDRAEICALRLRIEAHVERLLALLDHLDGDPDDEPNGDEEPSLGGWNSYNADDRELDVDTLEGEPEQDGDGEFSGGTHLSADEKTLCTEGENPADWSIAA